MMVRVSDYPSNLQTLVMHWWIQVSLILAFARVNSVTSLCKFIKVAWDHCIKKFERGVQPTGIVLPNITWNFWRCIILLFVSISFLWIKLLCENQGTCTKALTGSFVRLVIQSIHDLLHLFILLLGLFWIQKFLGRVWRSSIILLLSVLCCIGCTGWLCPTNLICNHLPSFQLAIADGNTSF